MSVRLIIKVFCFGVLFCPIKKRVAFNHEYKPIGTEKFIKSHKTIELPCAAGFSGCDRQKETAAILIEDDGKAETRVWHEDPVSCTGGGG
jgi:hypothetical protein